MAFRDAKHIFQRLRNGAVPDLGLDAFAVLPDRWQVERVGGIPARLRGNGAV